MVCVCERVCSFERRAPAPAAVVFRLSESSESDSRLSTDSIDLSRAESTRE